MRTDRTPVADHENDNSSNGMEILIQSNQNGSPFPMNQHLNMSKPSTPNQAQTMTYQAVSSQTIKHVYDILNVRHTHNNISFQQFMVMLRRAGSEMGSIDLTDKELDDYVSIHVIQEFAKSFIRSVGKMMKAIGYEDSWINCKVQEHQASNYLKQQRTHVGSAARFSSNQKEKESEF